MSSSRYDQLRELFEVAPASASDIDGIMALEELGFVPGVREQRSAFLDRIRVFPQGFLLLTEKSDGTPAGYICSEVWRFQEAVSPEMFALNHSIEEVHTLLGTELYVSSMTVHPRLRGHGLGRFLFRSCIERQVSSFPSLTHAILVVSEEWTHARRIYDEAGFHEILRIGGFFRPEHSPASAGIVMRRAAISRPV